MTTDLNTLLIALYVKIDDYPGPRTRTGRPPWLSDAELLTLAVPQVLLGVRSKARWLRGVLGHRAHGDGPGGRGAGPAAHAAPAVLTRRARHASAP